MVHIFFSADSKLEMAKLSGRLQAMGIEIESFWHDHKILCNVPLDDVQRKVRCLTTAERALLCLRCERLGEATPEYNEVRQWVLDADWSAAIANLDELHAQPSGQPWRWHVECKRLGPRGSRVRGMDTLVLKQTVREALHEALAGLGCRHDSVNPTMTVFLFLSPTLGLL
eukprot:CAMPEP_0198557092 /NCGR_PEP_ID=MMETSP1462-20131121/87999_1 /TAXON_ID=1333877 /ORGANISM="Brandtodinium nutriculum, Strain RCC3387" /LENGTH=169 /DNA_ID=CAMNT_0044287855 /DNA_START=81 /DNA_END=586 /DNA_ORIENTATION=+